MTILDRIDNIKDALHRLERALDGLDYNLGAACEEAGCAGLPEPHPDQADIDFLDSMESECSSIFRDIETLKAKVYKEET